ncbi:MAG: hypothetical protein CMM44_11605 [Rhodospirillaceae bacterium]|nr:hypothetical protein [Rhodospirillaceae bacterium]
MKLSKKKLYNFLENKIVNNFDIDKKNFDIYTDLIGSKAIIKSSELLEIFLATEEYLSNFSIKFNWPKMMSISINPHPASNIKLLVEYILYKNEKY